MPAYHPINRKQTWWPRLKFQVEISGLCTQPWGAGGSGIRLMPELKFVEFQNVVTKRRLHQQFCFDKLFFPVSRKGEPAQVYKTLECLSTIILNTCNRKNFLLSLTLKSLSSVSPCAAHSCFELADARFLTIWWYNKRKQREIELKHNILLFTQ